MAKPGDCPPPPHAAPCDPTELEKTWDDAQSLLAALNGASLGTWYWDVDTGQVNWSQGTQALFGLAPGRPTRDKLDYIDLIPEAERGEVLKVFQTVLDTAPGTQAVHHRIRCPDGSLRWVEISGSLQREEGRKRMFGVIRDITVQQERAQALQRSEQRFSTLFQLSPDVLFLVRFIDGTIADVNRHFENVFGWSSREIQGRTSLELNIWVDPEAREHMRSIAPGLDQPVIQETCLRTRDGRLLDGMILSQYIELDEQPYILTAFHDTTERKRAEAALRSSELKFAQAFRHTPDAVMITEKATSRFIEVNPGFERQFGWNSDEVIGRSMLELGLWGQGDGHRKMLEALSRNALDALHTELYGRDGSVSQNLLFGGEIELDGRTCLVLTARDISERQKAEAALRASQTKFYKAFQSSPDAITITARESGLHLEVNEGFCRLTGYSAQEVIGKTARELNIWADAGQRQRVLETLKIRGRVKRLELQAHDRHGNPLHVEASVEPIELDGLDCLLWTVRDISELKAALALVEHLAYHDSLTNLPNRALLMDRLTQQIALLKRHAMRGALLFLDLDHFKHINDSLGHPVGDTVLKMVTARLEASVRTEDTVARLGGDEFVVLLTGLSGKRSEVTRQVRSVAENLRRVLAEPMLLDGQRLQVTPSIGIALIPDHGATPADLLKRADIALYRAKDAGRNAIQLFRSTMQAAASERLRLENDLRQALSRGEFELHFQPQVDARHNQIIGAEALLRWQHPTLGEQSPALFIHVLEESGLILEVGAWVIAEACRLCARLLDDGLIEADRFSLCVNISPRQFRQNDFVERVEACLHTSGMPKRMLKLEITEGMVIQNIADTIAKMNRLKKLDVSFAIDDFGTGYSSLSYLKRLPVDVLKIDQSFVRDATQDPNDAEIVRAIVAMARSLGLDMIAEGVEQQDQLDFLEQQGCHRYQGYLFSRPLPLAEFRSLLTNPPRLAKRIP